MCSVVFANHIIEKKYHTLCGALEIFIVPMYLLNLLIFYYNSMPAILRYSNKKVCKMDFFTE